MVDVGSLARLRAVAADHGRKCGMGDAAVGDLVMVVNELATNAIRHGGGNGLVRLWCERDLVFCEVSDEGPGMANPDAAGVERIDITSPTGRGIWMIRRVSEDMQIETGEHGTTVTVGMTID